MGKLLTCKSPHQLISSLHIVATSQVGSTERRGSRGDFRKPVAKMVTEAIVRRISADGLLLHTMEHRLCRRR